MSLPSPNLAVPSLTVDQASFQGLKFGANTSIEWTKVEGLGKPKVRSGNTPRPRVRGSYVGLNLLDVRTITFTLDIGSAGTSLASLLGAARTAFSTEGVTEYPLWVKIPNFPLVAVMARVTGFDPAYDFTADVGGAGTGLMQNVPLQFECTDPYLYGAPSTAYTVGLPTPGVGFTFPVTFPLSFGGGSGANSVTVTNNGNAFCYPQLTITGPCLNPQVQNTSLPGNPTITFNTQLNAGDRLIIDCDLQSVVFSPAGSASVSSALSTLVAGSTFFVLQPGANQLTFNSQDTSTVAGTLTVWAADTYDSLF